MAQSFYEQLVMKTQMNYQQFFNVYASGKTPVKLTEKPMLPYEEQVQILADKIKEADHIIVGVQACQLLEVVISIMRIMLRLENILENLLRNTVLKELFQECNILGLVVKNIGVI